MRRDEGLLPESEFKSQLFLSTGFLCSKLACEAPKSLRESADPAESAEKHNQIIFNSVKSILNRVYVFIKM